MRAVFAAANPIALVSLLGTTAHIFPSIITVVAGTAATVLYSIQIWDRFATRRSTYEPPANEAVRDWHRKDDTNEPRELPRARNLDH